MFVDPNNPFAAAASKTGGTPGPFQPVSTSGVKSPFAPQEGSPFEAAYSLPVTSDIRKSHPVRSSSSPFVVAANIPAPKPSVPKLSEPFEGFTVADSKIPESPDDPQDTAGRDFEIPAERSGSGPASAEKASQEAVPAKAPSSKSGPDHGDMPQLVLRAIFGVSRELDREEILKLARALPGIQKLDLIGAEASGAMSLLRKSIESLGFGDADTFKFQAEGGEFDIIGDSGSALAVLHQGSYVAGVRETLIIISRELARLK